MLIRIFILFFRISDIHIILYICLIGLLQLSHFSTKLFVLIGQLRVTLLGGTAAGKSKVANKLRKDENSVKERMGVRKFRMINKSGWDKMSVHCTSDTTKQEIVQNVTEPPGSHALLFVLPVTAYGEVPSEEVESHCQHIELLSEKAWKFTIVKVKCSNLSLISTWRPMRNC